MSEPEEPEDTYGDLGPDLTTEEGVAEFKAQLDAKLALQECHEFWRGGKMLAFIQSRPPYCDRGRWDAALAVPVWYSDADPPGRYYFDLERAKLETIAYLQAKKIDVAGGEWRRSS